MGRKKKVVIYDINIVSDCIVKCIVLPITNDPPREKDLMLKTGQVVEGAEIVYEDEEKINFNYRIFQIIGLRKANFTHE